MKKVLFPLASFALLFAFATAQAEEKKTAPTLHPSMENAMKMGEPSSAHQPLMQMEGRFNAQSKWWMKPGDKPQESMAVVEKKAILGGRFLQEDYKGNMVGKEYQGTGIYGYDNVKKKYVSLWFDNMNTGISMSEGEADKTGKVFHYRSVSEETCPMTGKKMSHRSIVKVVSPDRYTFEMYVTLAGEKEYKSMEIVYSRIK